jgi:AraC-like DNA-binding protein
MAKLAFGRIVVWEGASLWIFEVPEHPVISQTDPHAHHAIQVTLALDGEFGLASEGRWIGGPAAAVAPDVSHAFSARGLVAMLFVEPETRAGRALTDLIEHRGIAPLPLEPIADLVARLAALFRAGAEDDAFQSLGEAFVARLVGAEPAPALHPRVGRMVAWARANLGRPVGIAEAADAVALSPSRASHLFVEQTGVQFRTYLLWLRLTQAVEVYAAGASLTEAAHEAGFSDSAHLSRTFRRMFGVAAAMLHVT